MQFRRTAGFTITAPEAAARFQSGELKLVDVRESAELAELRVPGALHVPLGQLDQRIRELARGQPVAFLCASGRRSAIAARAATNAGIDAANVKGGIAAWARAGLPLIEGREDVA